MSSNEKMLVTSEIFEFKPSEEVSVNTGNVISYFKFKFPITNDTLQNNGIKLDEDGDLLLIRKNHGIEGTIKIEHKASTTLKLVGLQVWRGALLLADYIMHHSDKFNDKVILELGTGVGLTSIVAAMFAKEVIATDIDEGGILKLIDTNISNNKDLLKSKYSVLPLDFCNMDWSPQLKEKIFATDIILAADVIYDNDLTEAFVKTITKLLDTPGKKKLYIALEKRYVFTVADLDSVAPCYEYFLEFIKKYWNHPPMSNWNFKNLEIDFDQYFEYVRLKHLVIWEIST